SERPVARLLLPHSPAPAPRGAGGAPTAAVGAEPGSRREEASLSEMFREVEELMEDTQDKLRNAVREMEAEEGVKNPSEPDFENLPPSYHNESNTDTKTGNKTIHTHQEIDKVTDNKTGSMIYSETIITSIKDGESKRNHECIIDEDCERGKYCQFSSFEYRCQLCKTQRSPCSRDVECCGDQLCVWGECVEAVSKGENGTICENQLDCNPGTCCAFQKDLLFPVCTPLPEAREPCLDPSNKLLNLITWELEPGGVLEHCPCASGLICQTHRQNPQIQYKGYPSCYILSPVSVCEASFNDTRSNENLIPRDVLGDYEDISIIQALRKELENLERNISEQTYLNEPDLAHDLLFGEDL
uniref:Dickkopf-related protein 3 n=1 Tax=Pelodiscus sinensis TaxID=13735 RepID=K7FZM3_PELSI